MTAGKDNHRMKKSYWKRPEPELSDKTSVVKTPKQKNALRKSLLMFRKNTKKPVAPSAAARAAACIEAEHFQNLKNMQKEEERKEQQAEANKKEQELRMELLAEKIKLTRTKNLIQEKMLDLINTNPNDVNVFKNVINE